MLLHAYNNVPSVPDKNWGGDGVQTYFIFLYPALVWKAQMRQSAFCHMQTRVHPMERSTRSTAGIYDLGILDMRVSIKYLENKNRSRILKD